jgi:hypothetical protein
LCTDRKVSYKLGMQLLRGMEEETRRDKITYIREWLKMTYRSKLREGD